MTVLNEEVLFAGGISVFPEAVYFVTRLDIRDGDLAVLCLVDYLNPALVCLAPCSRSVADEDTHKERTSRRMYRAIPSMDYAGSTTSPAAIRHQTPVAYTGTWIYGVRIIEVRPPKDYRH